MSLVAILGPGRGELARLLEAEDLPGLETATASVGSPDIPRADILFGPPDEVVRCLDEAESLRWVQSTWAGVAPLVGHARRDYQLTGVKGIFGQAMSEYVLGWLLALERRMIQRAAARCWDASTERGLVGRRLGIMGTGSIGSEVARRCRVMGLRVSGLNSTGRSAEGFERCYSTAGRLEFAKGLDYLLALLPETPRTDNLVDANLLRALPRRAIFINAGRANCVVDQHLLAALSSGRLRAAVLDVTREEPLPAEHRFWSVENLYLTSHTAAPTRVGDIAGVFADNYRRYRRREPLRDAVDFARGY